MARCASLNSTVVFLVVDPPVHRPVCAQPERLGRLRLSPRLNRYAAGSISCAFLPCNGALETMNDQSICVWLCWLCARRNLECSADLQLAHVRLHCDHVPIAGRKAQATSMCVQFCVVLFCCNGLALGCVLDAHGAAGGMLGLATLSRDVRWHGAHLARGLDLLQQQSVSDNVAGERFYEQRSKEWCKLLRSAGVVSMAGTLHAFPLPTDVEISSHERQL